MKKILLLTCMALAASVGFGQAGVGDSAVDVSAVEVSINVNCAPAEECYVAAFTDASGGFVAEAANEDDDETMDEDESVVTVAVACDGYAKAGRLTPNDEGMVSAHFGDDDLACDDGTGTALIQGIMPGGWYWINDEISSAVGSLLPLSVYGNEPTLPTMPGGILTAKSQEFTVLGKDYEPAATFVKHADSGRVGILSHLLPMKPKRRCADKVQNDCVLDAMYSITATGPDGDVANGSVVHRNTGENTVELNLSVTGDGHLPTTGTGTLSATWDMNGVADPDKPVDTPGVDINGNGITIMAVDSSTGRCHASSADKDDKIGVYVTATPVNPFGAVPVPDEIDQFVIWVACFEPAAASAIQGRELVPDNLVPGNPFPTNPD